MGVLSGQNAWHDLPSLSTQRQRELLILVLERSIVVKAERMKYIKSSRYSRHFSGDLREPVLTLEISESIETSGHLFARDAYKESSKGSRNSLRAHRAFREYQEAFQVLHRALKPLEALGLYPYNALRLRRPPQ